MTKPQPPKRHLEVKTYYCGGIGICVEINYRRGVISLVEQNPQVHEGDYMPKKWVFADRQLEYMAGWQNILDAMKHAVVEASDELEKYQEQESKILKQKEKEFFEAAVLEGLKQKKK